MHKYSIPSILLAATFVLYPLLVYFGLQHYGPRFIAGFLFLVLAMRFWMSTKLNWSSEERRDVSAQWSVIYLAAALALLGALLADSSLSLKLYPVFVNVAMFSFFTYSLWQPPTVIERIARLQDPHLPPEAIPYTRKVTIIWCLFFIANGSVSLLTLLISDELWVLYNGLLSYILMALLFAGEWLYRGRMLKKQGGDN